MPRDAAQTRLTEAAFVLMTETGCHGVTSRAVGERSGIKASGVNYYFGGRDGLLTAVFELAHMRATQWRDRWLPRLLDPMPAHAFPAWYAMALQDYAFEQSPVRSVLRELGLDAARSPLRQSLARTESEASTAFWTNILLAFGLEASHAGLVTDFSDGMATVHNHRPTAPEQLAWFAETCSHFTRRLIDPAMAAGWDGWRQDLRKVASFHLDSDRGTSILPAAVDVVGRCGLEGLTHRAVAKEAEVSLAAVTGPFPTRAALVRGVFTFLLTDQLRVPSAEDLIPGSLDAETVARGIVAFTISPEGEPATKILAAIELLGAAGRDSHLLKGLLAARATRGDTMFRFVSAIPTRREIQRLDAHILSIMGFGAILAGFAQDRASRQTWLVKRMRRQLDWLCQAEPTA